MKHNSREQGFVLLMTLVIMIIITLSSMAMMMVMRSGISASGNIAFRQAATRVADIASEDAFTWISGRLAAGATNLDTSNAAAGYYAIHNQVAAGCVLAGVAAFAPQSYDFSSANCAVTRATGVAGYTLQYVIHRMALAELPCTAGGGCMGPVVTVAAGTGAGGSQAAGAAQFAAAAAAAANRVYFRVTVKVSGPRRNNRFIQTFVY